MDVLHDLEKIPGFVYNRRFVTVLEEVANAVAFLASVLVRPGEPDPGRE